MTYHKPAVVPDVVFKARVNLAITATGDIQVTIVYHGAAMCSIWVKSVIHGVAVKRVDVCRTLNELRQQHEAELEARGEPTDAVSFSDFPEQSSAFIVHHTSILRNKRLLLIYTWGPALPASPHMHHLAACFPTCPSKLPVWSFLWCRKDTYQPKRKCPAEMPSVALIFLE